MYSKRKFSWMDKSLNYLILGGMDYDYYKLLGIGRDAGDREIKSAYRSKAKAFHPDSGGNQSSHEYFQVLLEAYQTLSDPEKRKEYDRQFAAHDTEKESFTYHQSSQKRNKGNSRYSNPLEATPFAFRSWVPPRWVRMIFYVVGLLFGLSLIYFTILNMISGRWGVGMSWILVLALIIFLDSVSGLKTGYPVLGNKFIRWIRNLFSLRFDG